jgi:hypothetical protein
MPVSLPLKICSKKSRFFVLSLYFYHSIMDFQKIPVIIFGISSPIFCPFEYTSTWFDDFAKSSNPLSHSQQKRCRSKKEKIVKPLIIFHPAGPAYRPARRPDCPPGHPLPTGRARWPARFVLPSDSFLVPLLAHSLRLDR